MLAVFAATASCYRPVVRPVMCTTRSAVVGDGGDEAGSGGQFQGCLLIARKLAHSVHVSLAILLSNHLLDVLSYRYAGLRVYPQPGAHQSSSINFIVSSCITIHGNAERLKDLVITRSVGHRCLLLPTAYLLASE